jgi:N-acetylglucosamine transport system substrate-binding protein
VLKKIFCIITSVSLILTTFSGCRAKSTSPSKVNSRVLTIYYYDKDYGSDWIKAIANEYKNKNPDVTINLKADSNLEKNVGKLLESSGDVPDILFLPNTNWQYWASKNYIVNLSDLFDTVIDNNTTLKQKIQPDYLKHCTYNKGYWVVPWEDGVTGFIYNKALFRKNDWIVPSTMKEFYELLVKIKAAGVVPIAWDGKDFSVWSYAVNNWWAQYEGISSMKTYLKMGSPEVYKQEGRTAALTEFKTIVDDKTNSMDDVLNTDSTQALKLFFNSKAAMLLGGSWTACKASSYIPAGFEMGIMRIPKIDGAKDANVNYEAAGGFAAIPSASQHISLAKDFLKFSSTDSMLKLYTKITSSPRPFIYDAINSEGLSNFGKSAVDIWESSEKLYMFSESPIYYNVFSDWPHNGLPYLQIFTGAITPEEAVEENYNYVKSYWAHVSK